MICTSASPVADQWRGDHQQRDDVGAERQAVGTADVGADRYRVAAATAATALAHAGSCSVVLRA